MVNFAGNRACLFDDWRALCDDVCKISRVWMSLCFMLCYDQKNMAVAVFITDVCSCKHAFRNLSLLQVRDQKFVTPASTRSELCNCKYCCETCNFFASYDRMSHASYACKYRCLCVMREGLWVCMLSERWDFKLLLLDFFCCNAWYVNARTCAWEYSTCASVCTGKTMCTCTLDTVYVCSTDCETRMRNLVSKFLRAFHQPRIWGFFLPRPVYLIPYFNGKVWKRAFCCLLCFRLG